MLLDNIKDVQHVDKTAAEKILASGAPVVMWGAGELGWYVRSHLTQLGITPVAICDNNPSKWGTSFLGLPVYRYEELRAKMETKGSKYNIVLSVGPQYTGAIYDQLNEAEEQNAVWYLRGYEVCGPKINYQYFRGHADKFEEAYASLADDFSQKVFVNVLNAKISGNFDLYKAIKSPMEYFDKDVVKLTDHEIYLDVGAFKGNEIFEFVRITNAQYDGIIALEPDAKTLITLQNNLKKNNVSKIELHNKGAWHKRETLHFHEGREGGSRLSESSDNAFPVTSIEVDSIDNVLYGRQVSYISMDIEGAECNALIGAKESIKKWRPRLAICVYHRREDMYKLLLLIKEFVPDYKFYMRHYSDNQTETVLYAI